MMQRRFPNFAWLTPGQFPDHAEDVALHIAGNVLADAEGQVRWMMHAMGADDADTERMVRAAVVAGLMQATTQIERKRNAQMA
jgi:hypothetical protein